jgi:hypothetical protein
MFLGDKHLKSDIRHGIRSSNVVQPAALVAGYGALKLYQRLFRDERTASSFRHARFERDCLQLQ